MPCCNKIYTCIRCHDELADHSTDRYDKSLNNILFVALWICWPFFLQFFTCLYYLCRRAITNMMCMKCLIIQPIGETCSTVSCNNLSMGRYYCRICKLLDDERWCILTNLNFSQIYNNLCCWIGNLQTMISFLIFLFPQSYQNLLSFSQHFSSPPLSIYLRKLIAARR